MSKNILAIALLVYALFGNGLLDLLDKPSPEPKPEPSTEILNIEKPSGVVISKVKVFSDLVKDPTDRAKVAIFNYEFAKRVVGYETSSQQINDVYALAGKIFFKDTLVDKYDGLAENIVNLLKYVMTDENHTLSTEDKNKLNEYFMGVAWILIQKG